MVNYLLGKIYAIRSYRTHLIYIGSTTQTLSARFGKHRSAFKVYKKNGKNYMTSFEMMKYSDVYIELLETCSCLSKDELHKREGEFIRVMDCVNKFVAGRSKKEWREDNREQISARGKQYHIDNKEQILSRSKQRYEDNKERILDRSRQHYEDNKERILAKVKQYQSDNKEKISAQKRQYQSDNKEKISAQKRQYQSDNKEKISARQKIAYDASKTQCGCGSVVSKYSILRHSQSLKHLKYLESLPKPEPISYRNGPNTFCKCGSVYKTSSAKKSHVDTRNHVEYLKSLEVEGEDYLMV